MSPRPLERGARRGRQRGTGLIEVLVAIAVMSFGLLAMARLGASALLHQKAAQMRLTGVSLAQYYAERARLNVYGFDLGGYDIAFGTRPAGSAPVLDANAADTDAARNVAAADQQAFLQLVASSLPDGAAEVVSRPSAQARELDIWLLWRDTSTDPANSLDGAARHACNKDLSESDRDGRSCMHFRVGL
jgi:type IV pilus assembly protein PilV